MLVFLNKSSKSMYSDFDTGFWFFRIIQCLLGSMNGWELGSQWCLLICQDMGLMFHQRTNGMMKLLGSRHFRNLNVYCSIKLSGKIEILLVKRLLSYYFFMDDIVCFNLILTTWLSNKICIDVHIVFTNALRFLTIDIDFHVILQVHWDFLMC